MDKAIRDLLARATGTSGTVGKGQGIVLAYVKPPPVRSRCLRRIADALTRYVPAGVEVTQDRVKADLVVLHVIGRQERMYREARQAVQRGQRYAVCQWVLRSSQKPSTEGWRALWAGAAVTWSYYDLNAAIVQDEGTSWDLARAFRFYHAPLGVDTDVFHPTVGPRPYVVAVAGCDRHYLKTESLREVSQAAASTGQAAWHLGPDLGLGHHVTDEEGMDDATLARRYSACRYVSGLRRTEGFEMPAAEGLLCGARPILFDRPDLRRWFAPWAVFISEHQRRSVVIEYLANAFSRLPDPITTAEWAAAAERFSWERIVSGFWERCLAS